MTELHPVIPDKLLYRGRKLRRDSTFPERRMWHHLRGSQLSNLKFRRQHAIGPFTVDFYCHEHRLVVELDGNSHIDRVGYDLERENYLRTQQLRILPFHNDDDLRDIEPVLKAIVLACGIDPISGVVFSENVKPSP